MLQIVREFDSSASKPRKTDGDRATARALVPRARRRGGEPLPRAGAGTMATIPRGRTRQPPGRPPVDARGGRGRDRPLPGGVAVAPVAPRRVPLKGGTGRAQSWRFPPPGPSRGPEPSPRSGASPTGRTTSRWFEAHMRRALAIARELDDRSMIADGTYNFAFSPGLEGDRESARTLFRQSMEMFQRLDDSRGEADSMWALSLIARLDGDLPRSLGYAEEASSGTGRSATCSGSSTRCTSWAGRRTRWVHRTGKLPRITGDLGTARLPLASPSFWIISRRRS